MVVMRARHGPSRGHLWFAVSLALVFTLGLMLGTISPAIWGSVGLSVRPLSAEVARPDPLASPEPLNDTDATVGERIL